MRVLVKFLFFSFFITLLVDEFRVFCCFFFVCLHERSVVLTMRFFHFVNEIEANNLDRIV